MSTPGARQKQKLRDLAWQRAQDAIRERAQRQRRRFIAATQGRRLADQEVAAVMSVSKERKGKKAGRRTK